MSSSFVRPMTSSCSVTLNAFQAPCRAGISGRGRSSRPRIAGPIWAGATATGRRVLRAVDEPQQVAVVEEPEAVHLVDHGDRAGHGGLSTRPPSSKQTSMDAPRMWNSRSPGRRRGVMPAPSRATNSAARPAGASEQPSQAAEPMPVIRLRSWPAGREPDGPNQTDNPGSALLTTASPPSSMVATRKMAAGVSGVRMGWGRAATITVSGAGNPSNPRSNRRAPRDVTVENGEHDRNPRRVSASSSTPRRPRSMCAPPWRRA